MENTKIQKWERGKNKKIRKSHKSLVSIGQNAYTYITHAAQFLRVAHNWTRRTDCSRHCRALDVHTTGDFLFLCVWTGAGAIIG